MNREASIPLKGEVVPVNTATRDDGADGGLVMVVTPAEAQKRLQQLQAFVQGVMKNTVDYGIIPGTGNKPALFQPGAQKLSEIYGFSISYEDTETVEDWDKPFFLFRKKCILRRRRDGAFVGDGVGSCNSREDRYAWRWVTEDRVPRELDASALRSRRGKYNKPIYRIPNEDIFSLVNTIEKMACKRALVHAVLGATRSSEIFTQDVEDLPPDAFGAPEDDRQVAPEDVREAVAQRAETGRRAPQAQNRPQDAPGSTQPAGSIPKSNDGKRPAGAISEAQAKRLWAITYGRATTLGHEKAEGEGFLRGILENHGVPADPERPDRGPSTKMIPKSAYEAIVAEVEAWGTDVPGAEPWE